MAWQALLRRMTNPPRGCEFSKLPLRGARASRVTKAGLIWHRSETVTSIVLFDMRLNEYAPTIHTRILIPRR